MPTNATDTDTVCELTELNCADLACVACVCVCVPERMNVCKINMFERDAASMKLNPLLGSENQNTHTVSLSFSHSLSLSRALAPR